ncbi:MAG TPA: choice-of-anchor D domain-containing protein [Myxococcales bacterium]|nr:choice-of-anchor D domain-containing protein [Myxococcales bacterium]
MRSSWVGSCLVLLGGCHGSSGTVQPLTEQLAISPASLDLGSAWVDGTATGTILVKSSGTAEVTIQATLSSGPFSLRGGPAFSVEPGATSSIPVLFSPTAAGPASATVTLTWDEGSAPVALTGTGLAWPACPAAGPCARSVFDPDAGACAGAPLADGTACDAGLDCLQSGVCQAGACLGQPLDCDDANACTLDYCVPGQGCVHQPQSACTGSDPCQIYACDPAQGCVSSPAPNGTPCASSESCQTATICLQGQCIGTPVPDGIPCKLWWEPCVSDATCQAGACDSPTADAEQPGQLRWRWQPDAGGAITPSTVDELGNVYLAAAGGNPLQNCPECLGANCPWECGNASADLASLDACGRLRWESPAYPGVTQMLLDGEELVLIDAFGDLTALFRDTGQLLWQLDLSRWVPPVPGADEEMLPSVAISDLALSPSGPIYVSGIGFDGSGGAWPFLAAILPDGNLDWFQTVSPGGAAPAAFGTPLVADRSGNAYFFSGDPLHPSILSYDPGGNPRFSLPIATGTPVLAAGADRLVEVVTGDEWALDGGYLGAMVQGPTDLAPQVLIDGQGTIFTAGSSSWAGGQLELFAAGGATPLWQTPWSDPGDPCGLALGEGQIFGQASELTAFDAASGNVLWTAPTANLDAAPGPLTLTLTATANLILSPGSAVFAYFAGKQRPPADAPWSRWRGNAANQASSAAPAQP